MKVNKLKYLTITAVFFLIGSINVLANGAPEPSGPGGIPLIPGGDDVPAEGNIDQAIIWLLIAGMIAALYFLQSKRLTKTEK